MSLTARRNLSLSAALCFCACTVTATEPVQVFTMSPTLAAERDRFARTLEEYPVHEASWNAKQNVTLAYTVRQGTVSLLVADPCEWLPIKVRIVNGQLRSAIYSASGGKCVAGSRATTTGLYLTPSALFSLIAASRAKLQCYSAPIETGCLPSALRVTYDGIYDFPIKIEDYSEGVSDYYWHLEITDISRMP